MLTFSTTHEERIPDHFIIRINGHQDGKVVYSRDAACYVKDGNKWYFGAISKNQQPAISEVACDFKTARRLAERTAELMWKADLASTSK